MKKTYKALFLAAMLAFTAIPALNPVADASLVAEAHGSRHGHRSSSHHSSRSYCGSDSQETGHYHCYGYEAHSHEDGVCPYNTDGACADNAAPCYESCESGQGRGHC